MIRLHREPLSEETLSFLNARAQKVLTAEDRRQEALRLWELQDNKAFHEVRAKLKSMAAGLERCMYCEDSAGTDIEHFWPKATYPEKAFSWTNYLLACSSCNSNYKREKFPVDAAGVPLLIDPTAEDPGEHLALSPTTGEYRGVFVRFIEIATGPLAATFIKATPLASCLAILDKYPYIKNWL